MNENEKEVLHAFYAKESFCKVKQNLEIGKMRFAFVNFKKESGKSISEIDCFMSAEEFAFFANYLKSPNFYKAINMELQKGEKYPKDIWVSNIGGKKSEKITYYDKGVKKEYNGPISRSFSIAPSSLQTADVLVTAKTFPAKVTATGAFTATGPALLTIRVPTTFHEIQLMLYKWSWLEKDYMTKKYCVSNMKCSYNPQQAQQHSNQTNVSFQIHAEQQASSQETQQQLMQQALQPRQIQTQTSNQATYQQFSLKVAGKMEEKGSALIIPVENGIRNQKLLFSEGIIKKYQKENKWDAIKKFVLSLKNGSILNVNGHISTQDNSFVFFESFFK